MTKYLAPAAVGAALTLVLVVAFWPKDGRDDSDQGPERVSATDRASATELAASEDGEQIEMTMHIMSKCPYGVKVVNAVTPVARMLGNRFKLNLEYIGRIRDSELTSMHGEEEVQGNKLQLCAHEHGSYAQWLNFMECQNENWRSIPNGWQACAQSAEVDVDALRACYEGDEGSRLLRASFEASQEAGARGSPTIFLNGESYQGGRSEQAFARSICSQYSDSPPGYCSAIPAPPVVPVTVLTDSRCDHPQCDVTKSVAALKTRIPGAKITELDYSTARGRKLFEESSLGLLPTILIGRQVEEDSDSARYVRGKKRAGDFFVDQIGRFDPAEGAWLARPEVPIRFLVDSRCKSRECKSLSRFESFLKRQIPNAKISHIEYTTPDGQALWKQVSSDLEGQPPAKRPLGLPLSLFGKNIEQEPEAFGRLQKRFREAGDQFVFQLGTWDPRAEICDNATDDDGDRQVDCDDDQCTDQMVCRPEKAREIRAFVMSQCPYGVQVLNAMEEVLDNFGRDRSKIDFRIEFVGNIRGDELTTMHGQAELDEDLREICAQEHYPDNYAFMDYVLCRNKNIRSSDWEECATGPVKAAVIRECSEGAEGRELLRESFELANSLDFTGSPSWLLNNNLTMRGRDPESIKNDFCAQNELSECSNTLTKQAPRRGGGGGGGGSCG